MADLSARISLLATRVANYIRDSVLPRLTKPGGTVGQVLTKNSSTDYDYSWITPSSAGTITSLSASLSADVALTTTSTWYDGPEVSLEAGTWLVMGRITHVRSATTAETIYARLGDGTNHYASTQCYRASVSGTTGVVLPMFAVITLAATTTIKLQATSSAGASASTMKAALVPNGAGNNATNIIAIRLA